MPTETILRKEFVAALRRAGCKVVPYVGSTMGDAGTADIFVAHKKWHGWIEFKGPQTQIKKVQEVFRDQMRLRGVDAFILRLYEMQAFSFERENGKEKGHPYFWNSGTDILGLLAKGPGTCENWD